MPRVGWAATISSGSEESSRATTTFWMLPPDREPTRVLGDWARMLKSRISWRLYSEMAGHCSRIPREKRFLK